MLTSRDRRSVVLTLRQIACLRAALAHVAHDADGLAELARIELDGHAWLTDAELATLVDLLTIAEGVTVIADDADRRLAALQETRAACAAYQLALTPIDPRD